MIQHLLELEIAVDIGHDEHLDQLAVGHDEFRREVNVEVAGASERFVDGRLELFEQLLQVH